MSAAKRKEIVIDLDFVKESVRPFLEQREQDAMAKAEKIMDWEIKHPPIDISSLKESDKGRSVGFTYLHQRKGDLPITPSNGVISSWNDTYIFVKFATLDWDGEELWGTTSHACSPSDLFFS